MREKFMRFMQGRYGIDAFSKFLVGLDFGLLLLSLFVDWKILSILIPGILIYVYFRMFSKNISARYLENRKYLDATAGLRRSFGRKRAHIKQSGEYRFFKCPACSQQLRVPRGKGKIEIDCPRCHTKFIKRS